MVEVQQHGAEWIAIVPFACNRKNSTQISYNLQNYQWWGERIEGVEKTIQLAKAADLQIMLKPQVYVPGDWPGGIDFKTDKEWEAWEKSYSAYLEHFVLLAEKYDVEILCLGTEFKIALKKRLPYWLNLIKEVRKIYCGKITYAANWDEFFSIQPAFWEALDLAGADAYYPLSEKATPAVQDLQNNWEPIVKKFNAWYAKHKKPVLFTEYGYLSVDGCAGKTWELEGKVKRLPINEQAQANALEALFSTFWEQPWWAGGFLWKWFPEMQGHEGYPERDYTPQGKKGASVLRHWYGRK